VVAMPVEVNLTQSGTRVITIGRVEFELTKEDAKELKEILIRVLESKG